MLCPTNRLIDFFFSFIVSFRPFPPLAIAYGRMGVAGFIFLVSRLVLLFKWYQPTTTRPDEQTLFFFHDKQHTKYSQVCAESGVTLHGVLLSAAKRVAPPTNQPDNCALNPHLTVLISKASFARQSTTAILVSSSFFPRTLFASLFKIR